MEFKTQSVQEMITLFDYEPLPTELVRCGIRTTKITTRNVYLSEKEKGIVDEMEENRRLKRIGKEMERIKKSQSEVNLMTKNTPQRASLTSLARLQKTKFTSFIRETYRKSTYSLVSTAEKENHKNVIVESEMWVDMENRCNAAYINKVCRRTTGDSEEMFQHPSGMPLDPDVMMEGYLYKRSSNAFKTWNRRWFQIKDNKLLYSHRSNELEASTVMEENLMLCLVRPAHVDRVGCFELVTPTRSHLLQADSESLCTDWMRALQRTILALHEGDNGVIESKVSPRNKMGSANSVSCSSIANDVDSTKNRSVSDPTTGVSDTNVGCSSSNPMLIGGVSTSKASTFEQIRRVPGNELCADCTSPSPKWVSLNLGVVLCIECSGVHRSLGVQMSKVRSLTMDSIDSELRDVLLSLGNRQVNAIFLKYLPETDVVPPQATENSTRPVREAWIKAKYVERRFAVACDERARTSATTRQEHLTAQKHKTSIGMQGVNRSSSYADVQAADSSNKKDVMEADPWAADLTIPVSPASKRLSACGSDTALNTVGDGLDTNTVEWPTVLEACESGDLLALLQAYAQGFDLNALHHGTTALHIATRSGQTAAVEFLLLNCAKINLLDEKLNTPLHLAAQEGHTLQVCQLLKRGAVSNLKNVDGKLPLDIAMEETHADIVTLFRVTTMRNEFNEYNNPMDETVDVVISDIASRAANEKLQKEKLNSLKATETSEI